ncbi:hypothetical protein QBZ16_002061 [Prototheca wickerhamii]|uniref:Uncharacterized protein n=1 Tax=Prototheca wickerhamii TaxID=3111 RepID=A0AAD9MNV5_PROWI|nr:hypothetical protein QBZ16_002061 [Prototheca wickerhamii]
MPEPADREGPAAVEKEAPLSPEELERHKKRRLEEITAARAKQEAENKRLAEERRKRVEAAKLAASSRPKVGVAGESLSLAEQVELLKRKIREQEEKGTESPLIATESGDLAGGHEGATDASVA